MNVTSGGGSRKKPDRKKPPKKASAQAKKPTRPPREKAASPGTASRTPRRMWALFFTRGLPRLLLVFAIWGVFAAFLNYVFMPLYVRKGSADPIPDLRGQMVNVARETVEDADLRLEIRDERYVAGTPAGTVVDQFPAPGVDAKPGRRVQVILATGIPTTEVPKLTGFSADEARYKVEAAGLKVADVSYTFSDRVFDGQVISQDPRAGSVVDRQTDVRYTVSLGREPSRFVVPEVLDVPFDRAQYLIRKAGLKVGTVTWDKYVGRPQRAVMVQDPPAQTPAERNDRVDLIINGTPPDSVKADSTDGQER